MNSKKFILFFILILPIVIPLNGCLDILDLNLYDDIIIYESLPTSIQYSISYGYHVNTSGMGISTVLCIEDLPEVINGSISRTLVSPISNVRKKIADNVMVEWNETMAGAFLYMFEITAQINANNVLIEDLTGTSALTIDQIHAFYPDLSKQYCNSQGNNETVYIDPFNPEIQSVAFSIKSNLGSTNSFLIAKHLFVWLKNNTTYKMHPLQEKTQPAYLTFAKGQGDCDDLSFLYISLCRSVNIPARFIRGYLLYLNSSTITVGDHMWVEVFVGGNIGKDGWIPVECSGVGDTTSEVHQNFGTEDAFHFRLFTDDGTNESIAISSSHISVQYDCSMTVDISSFSYITEFEIKKTQELYIKENSKRYYV